LLTQICFFSSASTFFSQLQKVLENQTVELTDSRQELNRLRLASSFNDENEMLQNRLQELDDDVHRKDDVIQGQCVPQ